MSKSDCSTVPPLASDLSTSESRGTTTWTQTASIDQLRLLERRFGSHESRSDRLCIGIWLGITAFDLQRQMAYRDDTQSESDKSTQHLLRELSYLGGDETVRWQQTTPITLQEAMHERLPRFPSDPARARALLNLGCEALDVALGMGEEIVTLALRNLHTENGSRK